MKKSLTFVILILTGIMFSGCGKNSSNTTNTKNSGENKNYTVSKSIWKSENGGETWTTKNISKDRLSTTDLDVLNIAINPYSNKDVIVGLKFGGYIKTDDGAETWKKTIFISDRVYGLSFHPIDKNVLYASGVWQKRGKLFKSEDNGENWKEIFSASSDGPFISALSINKTNPQIIYAATSDNQVMKSEDAGQSWENIYQTKSPVIKISLDKQNDNIIYFVTLKGQIFQSKDEGKIIENIEKKISKSLVSSARQNYNFLETDPSNAGWVYLAGKGGIIKSKDDGNTWEKIVTLSDSDKYPVTALAINPQNSQELFYGAGQATYKSIDGGIHWTTSQFDVTKSISVIKYDRVNPSIIYVGFKKQ